jgi:hypothetical protein
VIHGIAAEQDLHSENEGEEKFVSFEQASANVIVEVEREMVIQMLDSFLSMWSLGAVINTLTE